MGIKELLPNSEHLKLEEVIISTDKVILQMVSIQIEIICPYCEHQAQRRHSAYQRRVADLSWADRMACFHLEVRRFFCDNRDCKKKTFSERLAEIVLPYGRRTKRLAEAQRKVGLECGGEGGARVLKGLMMPLSGSTLLRLIRNGAEETFESPRVLGVDDWAWCKGQSYGTILVDLEKHQVIDLLPDRSSESLAEWLKANPGVEIISRDRAPVYIDGATEGSPKATQVADRWHLLKNLGDHLKKALDKYSECLYAAPEPLALSAPIAEPVSEDSIPVEPEKLASKGISKAEQARQETRKRRLARYEAVIKLHQAGVSQREISRQLIIGRPTVRRYINRETFPEMAQRKTKPGLLTPYIPYLTDRWQAGVYKGTELYDDIVPQGYQGSDSLLRHWITKMRQTNPGPKQKQKEKDKPPKPPRPRPWAARRAVWLLLKKSEKLSEDDKAALERMLDACPQIIPVYNFAQAFIRIVQERFSKALDPWIEAVLKYKIPNLSGFAKGLKKDKAAVVAALELPWSNGQVEGQVNRLKLIKRQMYGRAKFDLLRLRVLNC